MAKKYLLLAILVLGLFLRLVNLDQSFWLDEASQAQMSSLSMEQIWFGRDGDFHPPLFYLLSHFWLQFGTSEIWLRLLPVIFGMASIWLIYSLSQALFADQKVAYLSAFLLAINAYHIYYSQEFRSYSLLLMLGIVSMHALLKKSKWLFVVNTLLLYTHYSSIFLILSQFVYVLFFDRNLLKFYILHFTLCILLYLPWLPRFISQLNSGSNIDSTLPGWRSLLTVSTLKSLPLILFKFTAGRINLLPKIVYGLYLLFVLSIVTLSLFFTRQKRPLLFIWLFFPIIASVLVSFKIPQTQPFRLIYTLPALMFFFSQATLKFPKTFITLLVYISITGNFLYFTRPRLQREQWRQAATFLQVQNVPVIVKFLGPFSPLVWYAPNLQVIAALPSLPFQTSNQVFLVDYLGEITDPQNQVVQTLANLGFSRTKTYNFEGVGFIHNYLKQ